MVALELHMDDIHGAATPSGRGGFVGELALEINFKGGDRCETGKPYEHLKRPRVPMTAETRVQPNPKYLESGADQLGLTCAKTRPTPGVLPHRVTMDAAPLLTADDTRLYRSCVGALMRTILEHFGFTVNITLFFDSVAARGIAQRAGLEKVKAKTLWPQEVVRERGQVDCFKGKQG